MGVAFKSTLVFEVKQRGVQLLMIEQLKSFFRSKNSPKKRNFAPWFVLNCTKYIEKRKFSSWFLEFTLVLEVNQRLA